MRKIIAFESQYQCFYQLHLLQLKCNEKENDNPFCFGTKTFTLILVYIALPIFYYLSR